MASDIKIEVIENVLQATSEENVIEVSTETSVVEIHNADGLNGITPHIGANGNWWIGTTDTGVHAQGEQGEQGVQGIQGETGKSAYAYAVEGGYQGTEEEFAKAFNNLGEIKNIMPLVYAGL